MDNVSSFLETGTNFNNSISASFGSEKVNNYISYGNTTSKGMIPNNKFNRHNLTFRQGMKLFKDRVEINLSVSYVYQESKNRPGSGIYGNPLYDLYYCPVMPISLILKIILKYMDNCTIYKVFMTKITKSYILKRVPAALFNSGHGSTKKIVTHLIGT